MVCLYYQVPAAYSSNASFKIIKCFLALIYVRLFGEMVATCIQKC